MATYDMTKRDYEKMAKAKKQKLGWYWDYRVFRDRLANFEGTAIPEGKRRSLCNLAHRMWVLSLAEFLVRCEEIERLGKLRYRVPEKFKGFVIDGSYWLACVSKAQGQPNHPDVDLSRFVVPEKGLVMLHEWMSLVRI